jgi:hypothetical protein
LISVKAMRAACERVHGFVRGDEIYAAFEQGTAAVALHNGIITGYSPGIGLRGHASVTQRKMSWR